MANYAEALSSPRPKRGKKELESIRLTKGENGGHVAEHHFTDYAHKPETHVFGESEGKELMAHLKEHMGISMPESKEEEE